MTALVTLGVGAVAAAGWLVFAFAGAEVMPSYLAGWLLAFGIPAGALLLVLGHEALGASGGTGLPILRRATLLLPVISLFAIPVLLCTALLYHRPSVQGAIPAAWTATGFFDVRMVAILVLLAGLALLFSRAPEQPRRGLAVVGCMLYVCLLSLAAFDWILSLQPGLNSSAFGLLLISSQVGTAACLLAFVLAVQTRERLASHGLALLLTAIIGVWGFLHFIQFLIIWSANLPKEIVWYQVRLAGSGSGVVGFAAAATVIAMAILPSGAARLPAVLASVSAMLLLAHAVEALWLVTPAFRGSFSITAPDALATIAFASLTIGLILVLLPRPTPAMRHAR